MPHYFQDYATDPESVGYAEGEEQPEGVRIQMPKDDKLVQTGEVMPNVAYSQPHNVQKYRPELGAQMDNFENPYVVRNYPPQQQQQQQQQQMPPPYQQGYPGIMGRRKKRELKDYHWGIHRLMSTGKIMRLRPVKNSCRVESFLISNDTRNVRQGNFYIGVVHN